MEYRVGDGLGAEGRRREVKGDGDGAGLAKVATFPLEEPDLLKGFRSAGYEDGSIAGIGGAS